MLGMMAQALMDKRYGKIQRKFWKVLMAYSRYYGSKRDNSMMHRLSKWLELKSDFGRLKLLVDTMKAAANRTIDKSTWEDKHVFRVSDLVRWSERLALEVEFISNREFNDFDKGSRAESFTYREFIHMYIAKCLNYGEDFAAKFCDDLPTIYGYLDKVSSGNNAPHFHGIFILRKKLHKRL